MMAVDTTQPFSDPVGHEFLALRDDGGSVNGAPLKVIGLFQNGDPKKIFGLAWKVNHGVPKGLGAYKGERRIGRVRSLSDIAPKAKSIDKLFAVIEFNDEVALNLLDQAKKAAVSRDLTRNIFGRKGLRVKTFKQKGVSTDLKMVGNVFNPNVAVDGDRLSIERATVVRGRESLSSQKDEGRPVLSHTNALVGFILAVDEGETLVLPAIDIENMANVKFLTLSDEIVDRRHSNRWMAPDEVRPKRTVSGPRKWRKSAAEF